MRYKLIAFDMDGTLLDDGKRIPDANLAALRAAAERGMTVVPATGRTAAGLPPEIRELCRFAITINGGNVIDTATGESLYRAELDCALALDILDYAHSLGAIYDCYQDDWGYMDREMYDRLHLYLINPAMCAYARSVRTPIPELRAFLREKAAPVQKIQIYFSDVAQRIEQMPVFSERYPQTAVTSSLDCNIEINIREANKGDALAGLCRALDIDIAQAAAFGDGSNDLTMIQTAGLGIAMANSCPAVLAAADAVTADNNSAGVAKGIYEYLFLQSE